jgi:hypothetical protein
VTDSVGEGVKKGRCGNSRSSDLDRPIRKLGRCDEIRAGVRP